MKRDLLNNIDLKVAIAPQAAYTDDTPVVSEILDLQGYNSVIIAIITGDLADADATFSVLIEHGNDATLTDAAPVPDIQLNGTEALAGFDFSNDNSMRKLGYIGGLRYLRVTITPSGNTGDAYFAAMWALSMLDNAPSPNPPE